MRSPLLIADGDIATTHILARVIRDACGSVEIRYPETLFGTEVANRSVTVSRLCLPSYSWLPRYLERRGVEYRYFLDDNFWALTAEVDPHLADFFSHPDTIRTLDRFLRGAKSVVTMSRRLAAVVEARVVGTRTEYLNPAFDAGLARRLALELAPNRSDLGAVRIGYPTSRRPSVAPLLDAVVRSIVGQYGDRVTFEFVGWMPDSLAEVRGVGLFRTSLTTIGTCVSRSHGSGTSASRRCSPAISRLARPVSSTGSMAAAGTWQASTARCHPTSTMSVTARPACWSTTTSMRGSPGCVG